MEALQRPSAVNATFSLGPAEPGVPELSDAAFWDDQFCKLSGPEIFRWPLARRSAAETAGWLREWAQGLLRPGQLTTPVTLETVEGGVLVRFLTRASGYGDFGVEETEDEKWAATEPGAAEKKAGKPDGALVLLAEAEPTPRVRVARAEMNEGVAVKPMSEEAILTGLTKGLRNFDSAKAAQKV